MKSLAKTDDAGANKIKRVELLGYKGRLKFTQTAGGLIVELPAQKAGALTCSLKITGSNLQPVTPPRNRHRHWSGRLTISGTKLQIKDMRKKVIFF